MKKILLITHGTLCEGFKSAIKIICGESEELDSLVLSTEETIEVMMNHIQDYVNQCDRSDKIFILTDIPVGTTTKSAVPFLFSDYQVYLITGINLGLLLSIVLTDLNQQTEDQLRQLIEEAKTTLLFMNDQVNDIVEA